MSQAPSKHTLIADLFPDITDEGEASFAAWYATLEDWPPLALPLRKEGVNVYLGLEAMAPGEPLLCWIEMRGPRRLC